MMILKLLRRLLTLIFIGFLFVVPVTAQDTQTPESTPEVPVSGGYIFNWYTEMVFPQAVRFFITVLHPVDQIREVTLTIQPQGRSAQTVRVDFSEPIATNDILTDLEYFWEFDTSLELFSEVTYEWQIVDNSGQEAFVRDRFILQDERVEWVQAEDPLGILDLTLPADGPSPDQIWQNTRLAFNLISANTGRTDRFNVVLYNADLPASGCTGSDADSMVATGMISGAELACKPNRSEAIYRANDYDVVEARSGTIAGAQAALTTFFAKQIYGDLWQANTVPDWFLDGLAQFYIPTPKATLLGVIQNAARTNQLLPLEGMFRSAPGDLWQAQSYTMVAYIADKIGVQRLYDLANRMGEPGADFNEAYEAAAGEPLNALVSNLRRWLFTDAAAGAFTFTVYQAETPTPTATVTNTATSTATPTQTPTITASPSVTGVLSATPSLTPRPSQTPTRPPATITPRPAGSLFTPTPVPPVNPLTEPSNQSGILAVLFVALALVSVIFLVMRRRDL